jgi:hypothetical protein
MRGRDIIAMASAAFALAMLTACESDIQTTSGQAYLDKYETTTPVEAHATRGAGLTIDEKVRQVAAVEPTLRFPARIGLARIENGELSGIAADEAAAWMEGAERLGPAFGTFVPLNRLVAEMVTGPSAEAHSVSETRLHRTMEKIRLGAARQHLDAVLVYEVYGSSEQSGNLLSALNVTIIGAFMLPGEDVHAEGFASALLVDVRNGYPYGTARHVVERDTITPSAGSYDESRSELRSAMSEAAVGLVPEVETMLRRLHTSLAELVPPPTEAGRDDLR